MVKANVKGELLTWARERAGLTSDELSTRFPKLKLWERDESKPTFKQLESFARVTHAPIGYLFLQAPPDEPLPIPDFRTLAGRPVRRPSPNLLEMIYACQLRQDWFRDYALAIGEEPLPFVGSMTTNVEVVEAAAKI